MKSKILLEVYDKDKVEPAIVHLTLKQCGEDIRVVALRADGKEHDRPYLVGFRPDGTMTVYDGLNGSLGFKQDGAGRIVIKNR